MREERGAVAGPLVVHDKYTLWGSVGGTVTVVEGGKFYMRGSIYGDLDVEFGGRVHVYGHVSGNLKVARGSKVILSGTVVGDAINEGGRLYVDALGQVQGKVKTIKGETKVEPKPMAGRTVISDREAGGVASAEELALEAVAAELAAEAERTTGLLRGKVVARVWQHRPEAMGIEFVDGTRIYVATAAGSLEVTVTGRVG